VYDANGDLLSEFVGDDGNWSRCRWDARADVFLHNDWDGLTLLSPAGEVLGEIKAQAFSSGINAILGPGLRLALTCSGAPTVRVCRVLQPQVVPELQVVDDLELRQVVAAMRYFGPRISPRMEDPGYQSAFGDFNGIDQELTAVLIEDSHQVRLRGPGDVARVLELQEQLVEALSNLQSAARAWPGACPLMAALRDVDDLATAFFSRRLIHDSTEAHADKIIAMVGHLQHSNDCRIWSAPSQGLHDFHFEALTELPPELRVVDLSGNALMKVPTAIANAKGIRWLSMAKCPISSVPDSLAAKLQYLDIRGTHFGWMGVDALRRANPYLMIDRVDKPHP
jgi:hypothetical protein